MSNFGLPVFGSFAVAKSGSVSRELVMEICLSRASLALLVALLAVGILALVPGVSCMELQLVSIFGMSDVARAGLFDWAFQAPSSGGFRHSECHLAVWLACSDDRKCAAGASGS